MQLEKYSEFPHLSHPHMQVLLKCYSICSACAKMCMKERVPETAILCSDCADVCALAIKLHSGDSEFSSKIFALCSEICERCAESCGKMDSEHCKQCSEICKKCAEECGKDA